MDPATIDAARRGNTSARATLLGALQDPWYRFCLGLLRDPDRARDAVQETAVRFLRQLPSFRGESQLRTWSLGIALNVVREMRRARPVGMPLYDDESPDVGISDARRAGEVSPHEAAENAEQQAQLREVLRGLPDRQREALVLRFFEELSVEQTAAVMNCASGTVKATVHQALRALKKKLTTMKMVLL